MRERNLLERIRTRSEGLNARFPETVLVGPGDDCAVVRSASGDLSLIGVDQLIVGRHCTPDTPIDLIARKAIARGVSDIAAMGGSPAWTLAAAALPAGYPGADSLFESCAAWAEHWGCPIVGGDIATSEHGPSLSISVAGVPHPSRGPVLRSGARPGDLVGVTGPIGDSYDSGWHLNFEPRLAEARELCDSLGDALHAMIDLSDGLGVDADRVALASGVVLEIDAARVPEREGSRSAWRERFAHGEDHELLVTLSPDAPVPGCLTIIGRVSPPDAGHPPGAVIIAPDGSREPGAEMGWEHA